MGAALISYILITLAAAASVHQGEQSRAAASKGERAQREGQRKSLLASANAETAAAYETNKANRKKPNVDAALFSERMKSDMGPASTILAGRNGGGTPLLGSKSLMGS